MIKHREQERFIKPSLFSRNPVFQLQAGIVAEVVFVVGDQHRAEGDREGGDEAVEDVAAAVANGGSQDAELLSGGFGERPHRVKTVFRRSRAPLHSH